MERHDDQVRDARVVAAVVAAAGVAAQICEVVSTAPVAVLHRSKGAAGRFEVTTGPHQEPNPL